MPLIIVESPTKARTIKTILGNRFEVVSSYGHIRDLPRTELGIDVEHDFEPKYVIPLKARPHVKELRAKVAGETEILLATDEDREGEAIAQHIKHVLSESQKSKVKSQKFSRIAFHEITPEAITEALKHPRDIDLALVDSQKARRILDRLVGYKLSPLLWKKIVRGISAGRVQSVALRIIASREEERAKFVAEEYWTIEASFTIQNGTLATTLEKINGKKLDKLAIKNEDEAKKIKAGLEASTFHIKGVEVKPWKKSPEPPFITSTLQQTAGIRLGMGASVTMSIAQKLYETGKITYMRTDAFTMAQSALGRAKTFIIDSFGKEYSALRQWKTKAALAQEAHEAIRPTDFSFTPEKAKKVLESRQARLYTIIWQRALASQMTEARFEKTKVEVASQPKANKDSYALQANGSRLLFDGFTKVYPVKLEDIILPEVQKNETPLLKEVNPAQHFTQPLPRFSEATLIKTLKELGIGRPSTYAPTVDIIQKRRYVEKDEQKKLKPTQLGVAVNDLLTKHFPDIVDFNFTARMEEQLDEIAEGKESSVNILKDFYGPFEKKLQEKQKELQKGAFGEEKTDRICPQCPSPVIKQLGRFGPFYSCSRFPECKWAEQIKQTIGMKCPTCKDGDILERRTKKGKLFYGCSSYPKCTFASWQKPKEKTKKEEPTKA
ncbi:MAG: type I DNA topoisomerase [Candidatus Colwellbacteria bacterium]|nr:type I DNA topoisomerase [Candidatus Colwellbacteria bacterium]